MSTRVGGRDEGRVGEWRGIVMTRCAVGREVGEVDRVFTRASARRSDMTTQVNASLIAKGRGSTGRGHHGRRSTRVDMHDQVVVGEIDSFLLMSPMQMFRDDLMKRQESS